MIGGRYWSTGITVSEVGVGSGQCIAEMSFYDEGFAQQGSTQGTLCTRYVSTDLADRLDLLITDAGLLGIEFMCPTIYWPGDGEDPESPLPQRWRDAIKTQCERLGWRCAY